MFVNYYKVLGVAPTASIEDIRKAYREKAKQYHPDVNTSVGASELFILINEAHQILTDETKRYLFDLKLKYDYPRPYERRRGHPKDRAYGNPATFHYDWASFKKSQRKDSLDNFLEVHPFLYYFLFVFGMFIGFLFAGITFWAVYLDIWPRIALLLTIPGFMLVWEAWKGITGKESRLFYLIKWVKKRFR